MRKWTVRNKDGKIEEWSETIGERAMRTAILNRARRKGLENELQARAFQADGILGDSRFPA